MERPLPGDKLLLDFMARVLFIYCWEMLWWASFRFVGRVLCIDLCCFRKTCSCVQVFETIGEKLNIWPGQELVSRVWRLLLGQKGGWVPLRDANQFSRAPQFLWNRH